MGGCPSDRVRADRAPAFDPNDPPVFNRIDRYDLDPTELDGDPLTVTFRNNDLSPLAIPLRGAPGIPNVLPDETRVFCGHEYTASNLAFAAHVEPDNAAVREEIARVQAKRAGAAADWHDATPAEMTIPSTIGGERQTNPFMRASDAAELGRRRALKDSF